MPLINNTHINNQCIFLVNGISACVHDIYVCIWGVGAQIRTTAVVFLIWWDSFSSVWRNALRLLHEFISIVLYIYIYAPSECCVIISVYIVGVGQFNVPLKFLPRSINDSSCALKCMIEPYMFLFQLWCHPWIYIFFAKSSY